MVLEWLHYNYDVANLAKRMDAGVRQASAGHLGRHQIKPQASPSAIRQDLNSASEWVKIQRHNAGARKHSITDVPFLGRTYTLHSDREDSVEAIGSQGKRASAH